MKTPAELDAMRAANQVIWDSALDTTPAGNPRHEDWASHWAEMRAEERAYRDDQLAMREEDARWGR